MTREEAIKHLLYDWFSPLSGQLCVDADKKDDFCEAIGVAITSLRAQQSPATLDRSGWEAHPVKRARPSQYERFEKVNLAENGEALYRKIVTISEKTTVEYCSACEKRLCSRFTNYCPNCGRPLTEESWAKPEMRIGGKYGKTD